MPCKDRSCGLPKSAGRPKTGWLKLQADFDGTGRDDRWYCGWMCLLDVVEIQLTQDSVPPAPTMF